MLDLLHSDFIWWAICFGLFWFLLGTFCGLFLATRERRRPSDNSNFVPYNRLERMRR